MFPPRLTLTITLELPQPCGSINAAEGTSGKYSMQTQQTMLATLSLGPVGIADQLSGECNNAAISQSNLLQEH